MTNQELNEQVARKLGYCTTKHRKYGCLRPYYVEHERDFCSSIQAAWEIVEQERRNGYFRLHDEHDQNVTPTKLVYRCIFGIPNSAKFKEAIADTAPLAIVKAFLKLEDQ